MRFLLLAALLCSAVAHAAPFEFVVQPDGGILIRSNCDHAGELLCKDVIEPLISDIFKNIEGIVFKTAPIGQELSPDLKLTVAPGKPFQTPICPISTIQCNQRTCTLINAGATQRLCPVCHKPTCPASRRLSHGGGIQFDTPTCNLERGQKRRALLSTAWHDTDMVTRQIRKDRMLYIRSRCNAGIQDSEFGPLVSTLNSLASRWIKVNEGRKISCDGMPTTALEDDVPKIAVCHLNAALTAIHFALGHAAVCEILSQAEDTWFGWKKAYVEAIPDAVASEAEDHCAGERDIDAKLACMNADYSSRIENRIIAAGEQEKQIPPPAGRSYGDAIRTCPSGASDCKCADVNYCGKNMPFTSAELRNLAAFAQDLTTTRDSLLEAEKLKSKATVVQIGGHPVLGNEPDKNELLPEPSPSPSMSPLPQPRPIPKAFPTPKAPPDQTPPELQFPGPKPR